MFSVRILALLLRLDEEDVTAYQALHSAFVAVSQSFSVPPSFLPQVQSTLDAHRKIAFKDIEHFLVGAKNYAFSLPNLFPSLLQLWDLSADLGGLPFWVIVHSVAVIFSTLIHFLNVSGSDDDNHKNNNDNGNDNDDDDEFTHQEIERFERVGHTAFTWVYYVLSSDLAIIRPEATEQCTLLLLDIITTASAETHTTTTTTLTTPTLTTTTTTTTTTTITTIVHTHSQRDGGLIETDGPVMISSSSAIAPSTDTPTSFLSPSLSSEWIHHERTISFDQYSNVEHIASPTTLQLLISQDSGNNIVNIIIILLERLQSGQFHPNPSNHDYSSSRTNRIKGNLLQALLMLLSFGAREYELIDNAILQYPEPLIPIDSEPSSSPSSSPSPSPPPSSSSPSPSSSSSSPPPPPPSSSSHSCDDDNPHPDTIQRSYITHYQSTHFNRPLRYLIDCRGFDVLHTFAEQPDPTLSIPTQLILRRFQQFDVPIENDDRDAVSSQEKG